MKRGIAALGMKPLSGHGEAITNGEITAEEALRYAMSLPDRHSHHWHGNPRHPPPKLKNRSRFPTYDSDAEMNALRDRLKTVSGDGRYELYKLSLKYDNPQARMAHGFPIDDQSVEVKEMLKATKNTGHPFPPAE